MGGTSARGALSWLVRQTSYVSPSRICVRHACAGNKNTHTPRTTQAVVRAGGEWQHTRVGVRVRVRARVRAKVRLGSVRVRVRAGWGWVGLGLESGPWP